MAFVLSSNSSLRPADADVILAIQGDLLLARLDGKGALQFPTVGQISSWAAAGFAPLGQLDGQVCWSISVTEPEARPPSEWEWLETRALLSAFSPSQMHAISSARELHWWRSRNRFCGCCGAPTIDVATERAKKCPQCNTLFFPGASSAVIVAVTRGKQILLAHNRNFRPGLFSLLAGFVDPGETLEQAAIREVREEVGVEIGELRYVSSQPWPFPNSLMLGFRAQYVSGELMADGKEIEQAGWYTRDALPEIPREGTVAHAIIDAWLRESA